MKRRRGIRALVVAILLGVLVAPSAAIASTKSSGWQGDYKVVMTYHASGSQFLVDDFRSEVQCYTNSTGHHEFKINGQIRATTTNGTCPGGGSSTAGWHPTQYFNYGTAFGNKWYRVSGYTPTGTGASVTI